MRFRRTAGPTRRSLADLYHCWRVSLGFFSGDSTVVVVVVVVVVGAVDRFEDVILLGLGLCFEGGMKEEEEEERKRKERAGRVFCDV